MAVRWWDYDQTYYSHAVYLRTQAEATQSPTLYEYAAAEFEACGYYHAAARCRARAWQYRQRVEVQA